MKNFTFYNPVKIIFGKDTISELTNLIPVEYRVLITYGGGSILRNGVYDQVKNALKDHTVYEFSGIEPNPRYETLMQAVEFIKIHNINFMLAVGGGSVIDGTKFIAAAVYFDGEPWNIVAKRANFAKAMPFGCVLTLPATGSEMNSGAVISRDTSQDKIAFDNHLVFPKFSILDPAITYTLPVKQTTNGIVDTFVHVVEQYLTYPVNAPLQDRMAEGILLTLIEEGPKALRQPTNYDVRANLMWCSTIALNHIIGCGVPEDWSTHAMAHPLTALFGLDHAQALAVLLPSVLTIQSHTKKLKLLQYAKRIWHIESTREDRAIEEAINKTREFFENVGARTWLEDYEISVNGIQKTLAYMQERNITNLGEHRDLDFAKIELVLKNSLRPKIH